MVEKADKIIVIKEESVPDFVNREKTVFWRIPDPGGKTREALEQARDEIRERVKTLVKELP